MNQDPSESPSAPLPPPTLSRPDPGGPVARPPAARASGQWILLLALVVALAALALSGMLWQKLDFTQQELARVAGKLANAGFVAKAPEAVSNHPMFQVAAGAVMLEQAKKVGKKVSGLETLPQHLAVLTELNNSGAEALISFKSDIDYTGITFRFLFC